MRSPRRLPLSFYLTWCLAWGLTASAAAQTTSAASGNVQLDQYQPSPFSDRVLRLDGGSVLPFGQYHLGLDLDYALKPLVLTDAAPGTLSPGTGTDHDVVAHAVGGSLLASFGLGHRLELGVAVPLTLFQSGQDVAGAVGPSLAGVGNVRLGLKARLWGRGGGYLGAALLGAIPGGLGTLTHESGFSGEGRVFFGYRRGPLVAGARAGFRLRAAQRFYDVSLGNELTLAAGATWQMASRTTALLELAGATAAAAPFSTAKQSPLEVLVGARQRFGKTWLTVAGGPGLVNGYGSPLFRLVAAFTWANRAPDSDGDGIDDDNDRCPLDPEDRDDFQDSDGCPDADNDADGILDATDKCPNAPEDRDGFQDADGCPDPDNDGDGIPDATDKCPDQPETDNDFEDDDGCPDKAPPPSDKDKDGILDDVDECPEEPEDKDGFEDSDGCPDPDNDKDGILDANDKCPLQPETINGIEDDDGCPDKGAAQVRLGKNEIETLQPIYFDTDRSRVRHAFYNILGQIASLMKAHPEIGRCAIEGHTDDTGPPEWNQKLSALRAAAVIEFLGAKGVDPKRLVPIGHGEDLPWASNDTPEGRAKNRRVVFHIEGVNPADEKKAEQREERRRRIRRRQTQQQQQQQEARPQEGTPREKQAPAAQPPTESTPPIDRVPHQVGDKPVEPKRTLVAPPPAARPAPAPVAVPVPAAAGDDDKPEKAEPSGKPAGRAASPRAPSRTAPKRSPDAGAGPPPSLRDLLKLPPR